MAERMNEIATPRIVTECAPAAPYRFPEQPGNQATDERRQRNRQQQVFIEYRGHNRFS